MTGTPAPMILVSKLLQPNLASATLSKAEKKLVQRQTENAELREVLRAKVADWISDGYELKVFSFSQFRQLGMFMKFSRDDDYATVMVTGCLPGSQAEDLGVPTGAVILMVDSGDVTMAQTMAQIVQAIGQSLKSLGEVEITMAIPPPPEPLLQLTGEELEAMHLAELTATSEMAGESADPELSNDEKDELQRERTRLFDHYGVNDNNYLSLATAAATAAEEVAADMAAAQAAAEEKAKEKAAKEAAKTKRRNDTIQAVLHGRFSLRRKPKAVSVEGTVEAATPVASEDGLTDSPMSVISRPGDRRFEPKAPKGEPVAAGEMWFQSARHGWQAPAVAL